GRGAVAGLYARRHPGAGILMEIVGDNFLDRVGFHSYRASIADFLLLARCELGVDTVLQFFKLLALLFDDHTQVGRVLLAPACRREVRKKETDCYQGELARQSECSHGTGLHAGLPGGATAGCYLERGIARIGCGFICGSLTIGTARALCMAPSSKAAFPESPAKLKAPAWQGCEKNPTLMIARAACFR